VIHEPWENLWHAWGQLQVEALARAGDALDRGDWVASARDEAESWHRRFLITQPIAYFEFEDGDTTATRYYSQIAYDLNCIVQSNRALYEITGDKSFAQAAGVAGSWFFGNNVTGQQMYDPATGRGYDGIISASERNMNSGAESTIESLLALEALAGIPGAEKMLGLRSIEGSPPGFSDGSVTIRFTERQQTGWYDVITEFAN
jgi:hypothetical protein